MAVMGRYCKAYPIDQFEAYPQWQAQAKPVEKTEQNDEASDDAEAGAEQELSVTILYLQENFVVTDGIYKDEGIIFDAVTPEWEKFCTETLAFSLPKELYDDIEVPQSEETSSEQAED